MIRTPEKQAVLDGVALGLSIAGAARMAGVGRRTVYDWKAADDEFRVDLEEAVEAGTEYLEDEARRRAVDGTDDPIMHEGAIAFERKKYSDTLLIFLLKAKNPQKYRDNVDLNLRGAVTVTIRDACSDDDDE